MNNINTIISDNRKRSAYQYMKSIRVFSSIDTFFCLLYGFIYFPYMAVALFPLFGYNSAKTYNKTGIYIYISYLIGSIGLRIFFIFYYTHYNDVIIYNYILNSIGIIVNMWIIEICYKGIKSLKNLTIGDHEELLSGLYRPFDVVFLYY